MGNGNNVPSNQVNQSQHNDIQIPEKFVDPITKKIMLTPMMVLSSMKVYENATIKKWQASKRAYDPLTGIPMALGGLPALLRPRMDIKSSIDDFIKKYPSFQTQVFDKNDNIDWDTLFEIYEKRVIKKYKKITNEQFDLKKQSKQIFSAIMTDTGIKEKIAISYDKSIILQPNIPVVCFMGPSRNGKSTIVNDILGVKNAFKTSTISNVSLTKGAWIALYSPNKSGIEGQNNAAVDADQKINITDVPPVNDEFYLLDMEGLSHNVTKFTKKLFYACYAASNIIVWNDKNVASDKFKRLMKSLKNEMKPVANSDKKPSFIYLKRDSGDYEYDPFDSFDEYINKDPTFSWFRNMNIFGSISAYQLNRPSRNPNNKKEPLNFSSCYVNRQLLTPFINKLISLSKTSARFADNMFILNEQLVYINKSTALSITKNLVVADEVLSLFLISTTKQPEYRRRDMVFVAIRFNWDHGLLQKEFKIAMTKLKDSNPSTDIDKKIIKMLTDTKNEIYERIKNKTEHKDYGWTFSKYGGGVCTVAVGIGGGVAAAFTGGLSVIAGVLIGVGIGAVGGFVGGGSVGKVCEWTERGYNKYKGGQYIEYSLGRTDKEIQLDQQKINKKTKITKWDWNDGFPLQCLPPYY